MEVGAIHIAKRHVDSINWRMLTCRRLRCADVPAYDSTTDSPIHGLSFRPIPMVVGALILKRWIVQNGTFPSQSFRSSVLDDPPFQDEGTYDHRDRANESSCIGLSSILS